MLRDTLPYEEAFAGYKCCERDRTTDSGWKGWLEMSIIDLATAQVETPNIHM
jgi:hypothetical protein